MANNEERIARVQRLAALEYNPANNDPEEVLTDMLADLLHWAADQNVDYPGCLRRARDHFSMEVNGDPDDPDEVGYRGRTDAVAVRARGLNMAMARQLVNIPTDLLVYDEAADRYRIRQDIADALALRPLRDMRQAQLNLQNVRPSPDPDEARRLTGIRRTMEMYSQQPFLAERQEVGRVLRENNNTLIGYEAPQFHPVDPNSILLGMNSGWTNPQLAEPFTPPPPPAANMNND